jgi:hypothetical protein
VADRLQRLSGDEVERVLRRAIELQSETSVTEEPGYLDEAALERVAAELGIDATHLRRALAEELVRVEDEDPGFLDRVLGPQRLAVRRVAPGPADRARATLDQWMTRNEGMRKRSANPTGATWERDTSIVTKARMSLKLGGTSGALRTAAGVTDDVAAAGAERQLVTIEADTSNVRRIALAWLAGVAAAGAAAGAVGLGVEQTLTDNVALGAGVLALGGGGVILGIRMWINRIRDALARAGDAVAHPDLIDSGDSLPRRIGRFIDEWRNLRNDLGRRRPDRRQRPR